MAAMRRRDGAEWGKRLVYAMGWDDVRYIWVDRKEAIDSVDCFFMASQL